MADLDGGGIYGGGTMTITGSTISDNRAGLDFLTGSGRGGGIWNVGMLEIANSTVSGNIASGGGGLATAVALSTPGAAEC